MGDVSERDQERERERARVTGKAAHPEQELDGNLAPLSRNAREARQRPRIIPAVPSPVRERSQFEIVRLVIEGLVYQAGELVVV
jgi:hypothetical protein